jgi:hypothetical protein
MTTPPAASKALPQAQSVAPPRGQRLVFLVDPDPEVPPLVVEPSSGRPLPVERAQIRPGDARLLTSDGTEDGAPSGVDQRRRSKSSTDRICASPGAGAMPARSSS